MKAKTIYIVVSAHSNRKESQEVSYGLKAKYKAHCKNIVVIDYENRKTIESEKGTGKKEDLKNADEVGVYIIMHGANGQISNYRLNSSSFVESLQPLLKGDFNLIGKIVFVTCGLAEPVTDFADRTESVENSELANARGFLMGVMMELNGMNVRPKIVGWDSFISALPHTNEGSSTYKNTKGSGKLNDQQIQENIGRKLGHGKRYGLVDDAFAREHKRTFWIAENGTVRVEAGRGWSQTD